MQNSSWLRLAAFAVPLSIWAADLSPVRAETVQGCGVKHAVCHADCTARQNPMDAGPGEICKVNCAIDHGRCVQDASDRNAGLERPPKPPKRDAATVGPRPSILSSDAPFPGSSPAPTGGAAGARGGSAGQFR